MLRLSPGWRFIGFGPPTSVTVCGTVMRSLPRSAPVAVAQSTVTAPVAILVRLAIGRFTEEAMRRANDTELGLTAGFYGVNRRQKETDSNILIVDAYAKSEVANTYFEGEAYHIGGTSRAITLPNAAC